MLQLLVNVLFMKYSTRDENVRSVAVHVSVSVIGVCRRINKVGGGRCYNNLKNGKKPEKLKKESRVFATARRTS